VRTRRSRRSAEITVETEETLVVRSRRGPVQLACPACRQEVSMIRPEEAARIAGVNTRTIYRWVEEGKIHFSEALGASLLICPVSLRSVL